VREVLRDPSRHSELRKHMADGRKQHGTQTYHQHVQDLIEAGLINDETAKAALALVASPPGGGKRGKQAAGA
jgi:Tfp pilus assembly pilus retraction ATPase PilT